MLNGCISPQYLTLVVIPQRRETELMQTEEFHLMPSIDSFILHRIIFLLTVYITECSENASENAIYLKFRNT